MASNCMIPLSSHKLTIENRAMEVSSRLMKPSLARVYRVPGTPPRSSPLPFASDPGGEPVPEVAFHFIFDSWCASTRVLTERLRGASRAEPLFKR